MPKQIKYLSWIPAALWYGVIWWFSAQPAAASGDLSDRLLWRLLENLSPAFAAASRDVKTAAVELLSFFERKTAHMFLYCVLGLLVLLALRCLLRRRGPETALTLLICAVLAGLDEYHQTLVPGRSGELWDVLVDLSGAAIALGLASLPLLAAWCRRSMGFPLPALIPAALCLLPLVPVLLSGDAVVRLSPIAWAAERFVPEAGTLPPEAWSSLLSSVAPVVREVLFLSCCGLLGACVLLAAGLASLSRRAAGNGCLAAVLAAVLLAAATDIAPLGAAVGLTLLGLLLAALLWGAGRLSQT